MLLAVDAAQLVNTLLVWQRARGHRGRQRSGGGGVGKKKCVFLNQGSHHPAQGPLGVQVGPVSLADGLELWMMGLVEIHFDVCDHFKVLLPARSDPFMSWSSSLSRFGIMSILKSTSSHSQSQH